MTDQDQSTNEPEDAKEALRRSREMVTVGPAGVQITDLAQQVDYAQTMARARAALPSHLRNNVGDCLAVIDISSRAGLSPYMVASKTYVQNDRLCFESQLFHAFAQASGLLVGDLDVEYENEDTDEMTCTVRGRLRADPHTLRIHKSPPLKDLHPGYTVKREVGGDDGGGTAKKRISFEAGQKMKAEGKIEEGMRLFPLGSPLWDRKPRVQMFYDTSRDWVRIYCPRATLGIYTAEEVEEYGPDFARDVTPATSGLSDRLRSGTGKRDEGFKDGHAEAEIHQAKNGAAKEAAAPATTATATEEKITVTPETPLDQVGFSPKTMKLFQAHGGMEELPELKTLADLLMLSEVQLLRVPDLGRATLGHIKEVVARHGFALRIEATAAHKETEEEEEKEEKKPAAASAAAEPKLPRNLAEWTVYARDWIKREGDHKAIRKRWNDERGLRNSCGVTSEDRDPVMAEMVARCKELGE